MSGYMGALINLLKRSSQYMYIIYIDIKMVNIYMYGVFMSFIQFSQ